MAAIKVVLALAFAAWVGSAGGLAMGLLPDLAPLAPALGPDAAAPAPAPAPLGLVPQLLDALLAPTPTAPAPERPGVPAPPDASAPADAPAPPALLDLGALSSAAMVPEDIPIAPPAALPPLPAASGLGSSGTAHPQMPQSISVPGVPGVRPPVGAPALPSSASNLGSQTVGADMAARASLGDAMQGWGTQTFGGAFATWMDAVPQEMRSSLGAALALLATGLATALALLTGFRHIQKDNLLEHTFRHQVLQLIRDQPGIHLREVGRRLGLTTTNAAYHLRVLEKHGMVRSERMNGKRVYVPAAGPEAKQRFLAQSLLHRDARARVLQAVSANPGANQTGLATLTDQHQGAVSWHLRQLVGAGLVLEERTPRECRYRPTALGVELSATTHRALPRLPAAPVRVHAEAPVPLASA